MYPYWSYFTDMWPQAGRGVHPDADAAAGDRHVDERLAHQVADRIGDDPAMGGAQPEVSVQNRVVILEGRIDSAAAKEAAGRQAWSTPGVYDVCNRLISES